MSYKKLFIILLLLPLFFTISKSQSSEKIVTIIDNVKTVKEGGWSISALNTSYTDCPLPSRKDSNIKCKMFFNVTRISDFDFKGNLKIYADADRSILHTAVRELVGWDDGLNCENYTVLDCWDNMTNYCVNKTVTECTRNYEAIPFSGANYFQGANETKKYLVEMNLFKGDVGVRLNWTLFHENNPQGQGGWSKTYLEPTSVTACGTLTTNNTVYELSKNVTTTTDCFTVKARDIIFTCANSTHPSIKNWIDGDGGSSDDAFSFAFTNAFNVTIRDCIITDLTGVNEAGRGTMSNRKLLFYNNKVTPTGTQDGYAAGAAHFSGNVNISSIYNNTFNMNSSTGIGISITFPAPNKNVTNNDIWARKGIRTTARYSIIKNNRIYLSGASASSWGYGIGINVAHSSNISNNYIVFLQPSSTYYFAYHITPTAVNQLNITGLNINNTAGDRNQRDKFYYFYRANRNDCVVEDINFTNYPISNLGKIALIESNYCRLNNLSAGSSGDSMLMGGLLTNYDSNHTIINNSIFRINYDQIDFGIGLGDDIDNFISDGLFLSASNNMTIQNLLLTGSSLSTAGTHNIKLTSRGIGSTSNKYYTYNFLFKNVSVVNCKNCLVIGGTGYTALPYKDYDIKIFNSNFSNAIQSTINGTFYKDVYINNTVFDKSLSQTNYFNVINLDGYDNLTIKNSNITNNYIFYTTGFPPVLSQVYSNLLKLGKTSSNLTNVYILNNRFRNATSNSISFESGNNTAKFMGKGILNISNNIFNNSKTQMDTGAYGIYLNNYYGKAYIQNNDILNGETSSDKQSYSLIYLTGQHNYTEIKDNYLYNSNRFFYSNSFINNTNLSNNIFEKPIYIGVEPRGNNFVFKNNKFYIKEVLSAWTTGFYVDDATTNNIKIEQNHFNNTAGVNIYGFNIFKNNLTLYNTYCYGASWCITSTYKKNLSYINTYINNSYVGIEIPSTGNVTIRNATINLNPSASYTDGKCLYVYNYAGDRYSNLSIYNLNCTASSTQYSINADTYDRIYVYNSSLDDGILYFSTSYNNVFLNTTYKNNQQQLTSSNVTIKWYLQFNITETNFSSPINNSLINVSDKNKLYQTKNTSSNGLTNFFTVTSMILGTNNKDYNKFRLNASHPEYLSNSSLENITRSQLKWFTLVATTTTTTTLPSVVTGAPSSILEQGCPLNSKYINGYCVCDNGYRSDNKTCVKIQPFPLRRIPPRSMYGLAIFYVLVAMIPISLVWYYTKDKEGKKEFKMMMKEKLINYRKQPKEQMKNDFRAIKNKIKRKK